MQIKRFEAEDMTEALRMVKREFGDDAVILSAKETRPGGLFSAFRKKCVEITAATDYPINDADKGSDFSKQLCEQLDAEPENDRVSLSSKPSVFVPLTARSKPSVAPNDPPQRALAKSRANGPWGTRHPTTHSTIAVSEKLVDEKRLQDREQDKMTALPFYHHSSKRKIIALVGGHGTGKTTAIAKLARHCCMVEKKTVALVSLDRFRISANSTLKTVSQIMSLPFRVARDSDQLRQILADQAKADVILIDTPGIGRADDTTMVDDITSLLETATPDEIHLVVNATARHAVLDAWVETFQPLGIDHLLFTHMDEYGIDDSIAELFDTHGLTSAFYTDGVDLLEHLQESSVDGLERFCRPRPSNRQRVMDFSTPKISSVGEKASSHYNDKSEKTNFVANRNSELFHHPDCKSVKRINAENITGFSSIEQAIEQGFKPCRACCNNEMIKNAVPSALSHRRVSAI